MIKKRIDKHLITGLIIILINIYWIWDTKGIMTWTEDGVTMIYFSIDHDIERDGEITVPENQKVMPVIFLTGQSTQPDISVGEVRNREWKTIEEIKELCTTAPKKTWGGQ